MLKTYHVVLGRLGLSAESSQELQQAIAMLTTAGFVVENTEDDDDEPIHGTTIHHAGGVEDIRTIKNLLGLPYPGKK